MRARGTETNVRSLPTSEDTGIDQGTIRRANKYVQRLLDGGQKSEKKQERNKLSAVMKIEQVLVNMPQKMGTLTPRNISRKSFLI